MRLADNIGTLMLGQGATLREFFSYPPPPPGVAPEKKSEHTYWVFFLQARPLRGK